MEWSIGLERPINLASEANQTLTPIVLNAV